MTKEKLIRANLIEECMALAEWLSIHPDYLVHSLYIHDSSKNYFTNPHVLFNKLLGEDWVEDFKNEGMARINARILERVNEFAEEFKNL